MRICDCKQLKVTYISLGGSQGTYDIVNNSKLKNQINAEENIELKPNSMVNDDILKDLSGNYADIKKKLAE